MWSMQRAARFLIWGALAVFLFGVGSCVYGCGQTIDAAVNDSVMNPTGLIWAFLLIALSIAMLIGGAVCKALANKPSEQSGSKEE